MSIKDDTYDMLDLGPEKSKKPNFLIIGLIVLLAVGGTSAYAWQQRIVRAPAPAPISNYIAPVPPPVTTPAPNPAPPPAPTKKVPTPINIVITFDSDSADLAPDQLAKLQSLAKIIEDTPGIMQVSAYTDDLGSNELGQALSEQRAGAVVQALKKLGVNEKIKYNIAWYGELYPVADNTSEQGRALNRRVEIYFSPSL